MKRSHEKWPAMWFQYFTISKPARGQDSREHLQSIAHIDRIQQETCKVSHRDIPMRDKGSTYSVVSPFAIVQIQTTYHSLAALAR